MLMRYLMDDGRGTPTFLESTNNGRRNRQHNSPKYGIVAIADVISRNNNKQ